jgi:hypothetical protein
MNVKTRWNSNSKTYKDGVEWIPHSTGQNGFWCF